MLPTDRFTELEAIIEHGIGTFIDVGKALHEIRDGNHYKRTQKTFAAYVNDRWPFQVAYANKQIRAARVVDILDPFGPVPKTEGLCRPLVPLLDDPERMKRLWDREVRKSEPSNGEIDP